MVVVVVADEFIRNLLFEAGTNVEVVDKIGFDLVVEDNAVVLSEGKRVRKGADLVVFVVEQEQL